MTLKNVTAEQIAALPNSCYSREQIDALVAGRPAVTALDVIAAPIDRDEMIWTVARPEFLGDDALANFKAAILAKIDPQSAEHADCRTEPHFTWVSIRRHLEHTQGLTREQVCQIVFDALVSVVDAEAAR